MRDVFLIQDIETRTGDAPHTILTFGNARGRLRSAPFWSSERHRIDQLARGQAVDVSGTVGSWRGRRQLNVDMMRVLPQDQVPWDRLLPSIGNPGPWWQLLDDWRAGIHGPRLARTLGLLFDQAGFRHDFERCPASLTGHHARLGGLLQHTCEVAHLARAAAAMLPAADPDLLLAGALLHDIGKIESYRWDGAFETTVAGRVIGHVVLGARRLDRAVARAPEPPCTADELELLQHLILCHHGRLEFGAPVVPLSLEGEILSQADLTSARTAGFSDVLGDTTHFPADAPFSVHSSWWLDSRQVWRGRSDWGGDGQA